jgi:hypothetical protein
VICTDVSGVDSVPIFMSLVVFILIIVLLLFFFSSLLGTVGIKSGTF